MGVFDEFQIPYSALEREHEAAIGEAAAAGSGIVIRGGVARGAPSEWDRARPGLPVKDRWEGAKLDDLLGDMSRMEFTLRFTLTLPQLATTIVGTRNPEHLKQNLEAAAKGPLPANVYEEAKRRLEAAGSKPE
jgi:aryl-alcohol dehydrogenase-like predicted oxidoreductase